MQHLLWHTKRKNLSACMVSDTLTHPAKAAEWNEMPFGRDTGEI